MIRFCQVGSLVLRRIICLIFAVACSLPAPAQTPSLEHDYIYPDAAHMSAVARAAAAEPADGATITYTAFDKTVYTMRQFNGKYTAIIVSQADLDSYTLDKIRILLDRQDVAYAQYVEFLGWEPPGQGLLHVAYVKTCGAGCGLLGVKDVELDPKCFTEWEAYAYAYVTHEFAHNFDRFSEFLFIKPDPGHSWTDFAHRYLTVFNGYGGGAPDTPVINPVEQLQHWIDFSYKPYLQAADHTWQKCIEDDQCDPGAKLGIAQHAQAGPILRLGQLYGVATMKKLGPYLLAQIPGRNLNLATTTDSEKRDLLEEMLGFGLGANVACFFDFLGWPVPDDLRARLTTQFGTNALCQDKDGDGYTPIQGDLDDNNAAVHPGATEVRNGIDDDCNGLVDDVLITENGDYPNTTAAALNLQLPSRIQGTISSSTDSDFFSFQLTTAALVKFKLQSLSVFQGWLFVYKPDLSGWQDFIYVGAGATNEMTKSLPAGKWIFSVEYNNQSNPGAYESLVQQVKPWPIAYSATAPTNDAPGHFILRAPDLPAEIAATANPIAHFWVSNVGWAGTAPVSKTGATTLAWQAPDTLSGKLLYRVQFYDGDLPAIAVSDPISFNVTAPVAGAVISAASFGSGPIAPGEIVSIFGTGMGPTTGVLNRLDGAGKVDTLLSGTRVLFDGVPAPLFFVRADQINAVVPYAVNSKAASQGQVQVQVELNGAQSKVITATAAPSAPALFTVAAGKGQAAALNEDLSFNSAANPASKGSTVVLFGTGEGQTSPGGVDGQLAAAPLPSPTLPLTVMIGGLPADVIYKGLAPGFAGLLQINARVPAGVTSGSAVPVVVTVGTAGSQAGVTLAIR